MSFDFNSIFGGQIAGFHKRKNHVVDEIWEHVLRDEVAIETRTLRKWLSPQDPGLRKMAKANGMAPADREEYTCELLQSHLLAFSRSDHEVLAVHGPAGCGKRVLSSWIMERLQRPLGRNAYVTLSRTIG